MALEEYDAVILGAGFGAIATLIRFRKLGLKVRVFERGSDLGGTWYWNCYPGARVDSGAPIYQLFDKELWEGWSFKEKFPGWREIQEYFKYLDRKLDLKKDIQFDTACTGANFDEQVDQWIIDLSNGSKVRARWFVAAVGFAAKPYTPNYPGLEKFKGEIHHTSSWPREGVQLNDKRIAVIGTGASGVQVIQESAPVARQLTVYQRTPNYALPMQQRSTGPDEVAKAKKEGHYDAAFEQCLSSPNGFNIPTLDRNTFDDPPEEREKRYHDLLIEKGGFAFLIGSYKDLLVNEKANNAAYLFWRDYVRSRVSDPKKAHLLAPTEPVHPIGGKRPSLEQSYYEVFNLPYVDLIDLNSEGIKEFTESGICTTNGHKEFDVIALATGFDSVTGSLAQLDIRSTKGETIADHWKDGLKTAIGISLAGFPNMFFLYGAQAPTAFSNGPTCLEVQTTWIEKVLAGLIKKGITRFEAKPEKEVEWTDLTHRIWNATLLPRAKSWYQGSNIPGKKEEPLNFPGGVPMYTKALYDSLENNYQDWILA